MTDGLDRIDLKILRLLQADGRLSNAEIAARVGTSAATCHRRTQRLFADGYVRSVRARQRACRRRGAAILSGPLCCSATTRISVPGTTVALKGVTP